MSFDSTLEFETAFNTELAQHKDNPLGWRAGGRATKEYPNKEDQRWWLDNGPKMVDRWIQWRGLNPSWELWQPTPGYPAIELDLVYELNGVTIKGFVDRVFVDGNGQLVIVDLKTGSREPDTPLQLALYAIGIEKKFGVRPQWGGYWMARKGLIPQLFLLDPFTDELVGEWVTSFKTAVANEVFVPHLSPMCKSCGVNSACVAYQALNQSSFIVSE